LEVEELREEGDRSPGGAARQSSGRPHRYDEGPIVRAWAARWCASGDLSKSSRDRDSLGYRLPSALARHVPL
jgi:hypothetical protein